MSATVTTLSGRLLELVAVLDYPTPEVAEACNLRREELESHYVRLFINDLGGVKAPPYAGCHLDRDNRLEFMTAFSGFCRQQGICIDETQPPDFIPMMMETLAFLSDHGRDAVALKEVVFQYYSNWPERFAAALEQQDELGMYAQVADEFRRLLEQIQNS
jgi:putative dimethyl sulfoxide reductase chaperone